MFRNKMEKNATARQDPPKRIRTTSAKTETTNTTVQTATVFNERTRTVSYQTTRQTMTHQQQAGITEINTTLYTPDAKELESMLAELGISNHQFPPTQQTTALVKAPTTNLKTSKTVITHSKGQNISSEFEEHRINFDKAKSSWSNLERPNSTTNRGNEKNLPYAPRKTTTKIDAKPYGATTPITTPMLRSTTPSPSTISRTSIKVPKTPHTPIVWKPSKQFDDPLKKSIFPMQQKEVGTYPKSGATSKPQRPFLKPGLAFIFNNEKFEDSQANRVGSDADVKALKQTFEMFDLSVEVYKDPNFAKIKGVVRTIANRDFKRYSCLVIAILTHGSRNERVQASDKFYSIDDDVLFPIVKNPSLTDKPKILFIQACKGAMEIEDFHRDSQQINGTPSEILKCYSTFEGFVSYRTEQGTFFIQKLCEELKKNGKTESIEVIMRSVTSSVKQFTGGKQIPTMTVNLTEPFIFGDYM